ncbi:hypothetical protein OG949_20915 [Streptomyces scopuliridis]|uniref:hypothetical protein n=1 Tax=Streptomyces scopuliridis TaxID=452529 RepID=UPI002DDB3390|nr:hypothetical protein [Streptomyces scopuliridis]WSB35066.1 hypothetical protein OG949_20915 [Streptomyces scopuliridis]
MYARRRRRYFLLMGGCLVLFVSAWTFVRDISVPAAVIMSFVAMLIPPAAAIVGNTKDRDDRWWDEPPVDAPTESEKWLDELEHRDHHHHHDERRRGWRVSRRAPARRPP